ncbi:EpsG family protein [Eubacteriales bacterium OttesenSCG-928-M02]|nr:EpsG family protein [Eubacteriales bacterium OttesenSCG-928-M02]
MFSRRFAVAGYLEIPVTKAKNLRIRADWILWIVLVLSCILLGGLRYNVGTDYTEYVKVFERIVKNPEYTNYMEEGYLSLNRLVATFTNDPVAIMFVTCSIIVFFAIYRIARSSKFVPLSLFMFFTFYLTTFNTIRQGLAVAICFFSMDFFKNDKWLQGFLSIALAMTFHKTAIIMLVVFVSMRVHYNWRFYFLAAVAFATLAFGGMRLVNPIIQVFYKDYALQDLTVADMFRNISPVQVALCGIYTVLANMYKKQMLQRSKGNILYINICIVYLLCNVFLTWLPEWNRLNDYFNILFALIIPEIISCEPNRKLRLLYYGVIWGSMGLFWFLPMLMGNVDGLIVSYYTSVLGK